MRSETGEYSQGRPGEHGCVESEEEPSEPEEESDEESSEPEEESEEESSRRSEASWRHRARRLRGVRRTRSGGGFEEGEATQHVRKP